nr:MAG TPA: hypothetical protein [Caudoviricetes sp.]
MEYGGVRFPAIMRWGIRSVDKPELYHLPYLCILDIL